MPTSYTDQFFLFDPGSTSGPYALPFAATVFTYTYIDNNDDGFIEPGNGDTINGDTVTRVWVGDTITLDGVVITGVTFYTAEGNEYFTPTDGTILSDGTITAVTFVSISTQIDVTQLSPPCFVAGTLIRTTNGDVAVEDLQVGDMITTLDHGPQPIRWIGRRVVSGRGKFAPVRILKGAMGNTRDLLVSPQHRMLLQDWRAEVYFGVSEVLASAKHLCNGDTIHVQECAEVAYFHILFDQHEIVFAEGAASESFLPGAYLLEADKAVREELQELFPELENGDPADIWQMARFSLKQAEAALLAGTP